MTAKLYCFGESGNAYKAALTLTLAEMEWEPVYVDFFNGETRTPAFRAINEMGEVPVLVDGDVVLTQSGVIQDYVSSKTGKLGGRSAAERRDVLRWVFWDNHKLSGTIGIDPVPDELPARGKAPGRGDRVSAGAAEVGVWRARRPSGEPHLDGGRSA